MPNGYRPSDYAGNWFQRGLRWGVDKVFPGNQRAPDGTLNNRAVLLGGLARGAGFLTGLAGGGPVGSLAVNKLGGHFVDRFSGNGDALGAITRQPFDYTGSVSLPGMSPTGGIMPPQLAGTDPGQPAAPSTDPFIQYGTNLGLPTMPGVNARQIGGNLNFGANGHFNNGVGAGTGYGAGNIMNDGWGDAARGFGIGATSAGSGGNFALMDAMSQNKRNRV